MYEREKTCSPVWFEAKSRVEKYLSEERWLISHWAVNMEERKTELLLLLPFGAFCVLGFKKKTQGNTHNLALLPTEVEEEHADSVVGGHL